MEQLPWRPKTKSGIDGFDAPRVEVKRSKGALFRMWLDQLHRQRYASVGQGTECEELPRRIDNASVLDAPCVRHWPGPLAGFSGCDLIGRKSFEVGVAVWLTARQGKGVVEAASLLAGFNVWGQRSRREGGAVIDQEPMQRRLRLFFELLEEMQLRGRTQ